MSENGSANIVVKLQKAIKLKIIRISTIILIPIIIAVILISDLTKESRRGAAKETQKNFYTQAGVTNLAELVEIAGDEKTRILP